MDSTQKSIKVGNFNVSNDLPFCLISGPCQIESRDHSIMVCEEIANVCSKLNINFIFKSSFDKANRTSASAQRGVGIKKAIEIFNEIRNTFKCPVLTDVHESWQCKEISSVVDVLQIPAFLCRQTDLLEAAAETGRVVNVKKGQFLAPWDMSNVVKKLETFKSNGIFVTERGASFGYNTLVSDMRSLAIMRQNNYPVIFDATHSVQQPGGLGGHSGGQREFVELLSRAALASTKIAGVFAEIHQDPDNAPSDGPCMIKLSDTKNFLTKMKAIDDLSKSFS